jgi:hypothetical protein
MMSYGQLTINYSVIIRARARVCVCIICLLTIQSFNDWKTFMLFNIYIAGQYYCVFADVKKVAFAVCAYNMYVYLTVTIYVPMRPLEFRFL